MSLVTEEEFLEFVCDKKYRTHKGKIVKKLSLESHDKLMDSISLAFDILNTRVENEKKVRLTKIARIHKKI